MEIFDAVILGHGLAGATLAWHLRWRGWRVLVVDRDERVTSSKVAAGIVVPISGQRIARSWRVEEFLPVAQAFYDRAAAQLGLHHYHNIPYVRLLKSEDEQRRWEERRRDATFQKLITDPQPEPLVDRSRFYAEEGGFEMKGAWLDVRGWLQASRDHLERAGAWLTADIPPEEVTVAEHAVVAAGRQARYLIFCQGHEAAANPFFPWLRWKSAKGEILTLHAPELNERRIINRGGWLLPGADGYYRSGSTYEWDDLTATPTAAGRGEIEARLHRLLRVPFQITAHEAGVRPIINESKALIGLHPVHRRIALFNGLGSKGVLHAPFFAAQLAALLVDGTPVEYEMDVCRN